MWSIDGVRTEKWNSQLQRTSFSAYWKSGCIVASVRIELLHNCTYTKVGSLAGLYEGLTKVMCSVI